MPSDGAKLMGRFMKIAGLIPLAAILALTACAPKPAANAAASTAAINGPADCAADGLKPGTEGYNDCVSALADANNAAATDPSAMRAQMEADAAKQRAQMQDDMAKQRASMQADMNSAMADAQNPQGGAGCKTTTDANNNVSTQCP